MNNVQHYRELAELSQKNLADRAKCSQPTIAAIEAGGTTNVQLAQRIAAVLDRPLELLFPPADSANDTAAA